MTVAYQTPLHPATHVTRPLRVYLDLQMPEARDVLEYMESRGIRYRYIPTRWAAPRVSYGHRKIVGVKAVLSFLEELINERK